MSYIYEHKRILGSNIKRFMYAYIFLIEVRFKNKMYGIQFYRDGNHHLENQNQAINILLK